MKKLHKKGTEMYTADTVMFYVVFGFILSILMISFMFIILKHVEDTSRTPPGIEEFIATERFLSRDCFALNDINSPKIISWDEFTKENLDSCYNIEKKDVRPAFVLELKIPNNEPKKIKTINWNDEIAPKIIKSPIKTDVYYNNQVVAGELILWEQNV